MAGLSAEPLPPIVVLLGGPSAEHDVSVVSGTAIADALAQGGADVRQVLIDLDGRWWWLPADHRRGDRPAAAYDDPPSLAAEGPLEVGAAIDRLAAEGLRSRMLLQVHDELVFEVADGEREACEALVRREMAAAAELTVSLDVSVGYGRSWDGAAH